MRTWKFNFLYDLHGAIHACNCYFSLCFSKSSNQWFSHLIQCPDHSEKIDRYKGNECCENNYPCYTPIDEVVDQLLCIHILHLTII